MKNNKNGWGLLDSIHEQGMKNVITMTFDDTSLNKRKTIHKNKCY